LARNADSPIGFILNQAALSSAPAARPAGSVAALTPSEAPAKHKERGSARLAVARSTVCVRLCDGYFFPADNAAACGALCPGAATEAFFKPPGVDGVDQALSATGRKYTALANAFRYRTSFDETCSCQGGRMANASLLALADPTLRQGDVVMTQNGMRVFRGGPLKGSSAFIGLAKAKLPPEKRSILLAMERVSAPGSSARRPSPEPTPTAAKAPPRHMRTASIHWAPLIVPRPAGGAHALWAQRPGFRVYDLSDAYW
jgi:hypothetical protein